MWPILVRKSKQHGNRNILFSIVCFSFSFSSRLHRSARKGPYALRPVSQQSPLGGPRNHANICLVEHRSFSTLEDGMSAASFLHSSFLQAISAVMLWPVHVEKVPQASEHLCPTLFMMHGGLVNKWPRWKRTGLGVRVTLRLALTKVFPLPSSVLGGRRRSTETKP